MNKNSSLLLAAVIAATLTNASAADITGKITLKGTPPPERVLPMDPSCGKLHTTKPTTRLYLVGPNSELADTFVYIKDGLTGKTFPVPSEAGVLDQIACEYVPYVMGLQTKQKLLVKNSDPLLHNVHITPDPKSGNKTSNRAQMAGARPFEYTFDNPEIFLRFKCDVHPWMFAYVGLVDHPFYSVSDKDGTFTIKNVPPGKYTIEAFHRKAGKATKEITIDQDNVSADFAFDVVN
jgi:hypothetical protein